MSQVVISVQNAVNVMLVINAIRRLRVRSFYVADPTWIQLQEEMSSVPLPVFVILVPMDDSNQIHWAVHTTSSVVSVIMGRRILQREMHAYCVRCPRLGPLVMGFVVRPV